MTFLLKSFHKLPKSLVKVSLLRDSNLSQQSLKTACAVFYSGKTNWIAKQADTSKPPRKAKDAPKITLFQNDQMTVVSLEEAKHLAKRRSMHLVKVQDMDSKTERPVYKILTSAEMLENELPVAKATNTDKISAAVVHKKTEKSVSITSRIGQHDLDARVKNITKWLSKQREVRVLIQAESKQDLANAEKIFKAIEENVKNPQVIGRIVQKHISGCLIKFNILPVAPANPSTPADSNQ